MIEGRAGWSGVEPQAQETGHAEAYTICRDGCAQRYDRHRGHGHWGRWQGNGLRHNPQYWRSAGEAGQASAPGRRRTDQVLLRSRPMRLWCSPHPYQDEDCMVAAPSMIPRKSGERQKTDKRDAANLAVLHRGGLLTAVWVPDAAHEARRDLIRARLAAVRAVRAARQQLSAFLLRHERIYRGSQPWTKAHR